jgi:hypothetical protein
LRADVHWRIVYLMTTTTKYTAIEQAALSLMLQEAVRNKDKEMFATIVEVDESPASEAKVQALLDQFFR